EVLCLNVQECSTPSPAHARIPATGTDSRRGCAGSTPATRWWTPLSTKELACPRQAVARRQPMRPSPALNSNDREEQAIPLTTEVTIPLTPFDQREYRELIEARGETIRRVVSKLKPAL